MVLVEGDYGEVGERALPGDVPAECSAAGIVVLVGRACSSLPVSFLSQQSVWAIDNIIQDPGLS